MRQCFIYHHQGLGDQIMCAGIIMEYAKTYDIVYVPCKQTNLSTVLSLYNSKNVEVVPFNDDNDVIHYISKLVNCDVITPICFTNDADLTIDERFYKTANVPFEKKWSNFDVIRSFNREDDLKSRINIDLSKPHKLIHHDVGRGRTIRNEFLTGPIVDIHNPNNKTDNLVDYVNIIKKADEIHVIESSFMFLVDCLNYTNIYQKLYIHKYASSLPDWWTRPRLKKKWTFIE